MKDEIKILVVDDTESSRELLAEALTERRYVVDTAASAEAAIATVEAAGGQFDFIVMDQVMPGGKDGIEATRFIHRRYPQIHIIVMTIYGDGESSQQALDVGAYRYVFRPVALEEATQDIFAVIESSGTLAEIETRIAESLCLPQLFKGVNMAIGVIDRTYRVLYANDAQNQIADRASRVGGICWVEWHQATQQKGPCPWCPVRPLFEGRDPVDKVVPLVKQGILKYWQTSASPILDERGQIVGALKWGIDVTEREQAHVAAITAQDIDERLEAALNQVQMLGYSRVRLYELSEDGTMLIGRKQLGGMNVPITSLRLRLEEDRYSQIALKNRAPVLYHRGDHGVTLFDAEIDREGVVEWLDVPLWTSDNQLVGKMSVDNKIIQPIRPDRPAIAPAITDEHFESLLVTARFAANAIHEMREHERAIREAELQRQLREIDAAIAQHTSVDPLLHSIVERAVDLLKASGGSLLLCDHGQQQVRIVVSHNLDVLKGLTLAFGEGLAGKVAQTGQPKILNNYYAAPEHSPQFDRPPYQDLFRSVIGVPMLWLGEVIGVLNVTDKTPGRLFDTHDTELLTSLADRAAIAWGNARLYEQTDRQAKEMATLFEFSQSLSTSRNPDHILDLLVRWLGQLVEYEGCSIHTLDRSAQMLKPIRVVGKYSEQISAYFLELGKGIVGDVARNGKGEVVNEAHCDLRSVLVPGTPEDPQALLVVPLIVRGEVIGTVSLDRYESRFFDDHDLQLVTTMVNQASTTIESIHLFEDAQHRIRDLEIVKDVGRDMSAKLRIQELLQTIVTQVVTHLNCTHCTLFFPEDEEGEHLLVPKVTYGVGSEAIMSRRFRLGEGLAGWVFQNGETLRLADARVDPRFAPARRRADQPRPMIVTPLRVGDEIIAVLNADRDGPKEFDENGQRLVEALAAQAAIAIENAELFERTEKQAIEMSTLFEVSKAITSPLEIDQVLERIFDLLGKLVPFKTALLFLTNRYSDELVVEASRGYDRNFLAKQGFVFRIGEGYTGKIVETRRPLLIEDVELHRDLRPKYPFIDESKLLRSFVGVPLVVQSQLIGVLELTSEQSRAFSRNDLTVLDALADQLAIAITRARLLKVTDEELRKHVSELQALRRADGALLSTVELDRVLEVILDEIRDLIGADCALVRLYEKTIREGTPDVLRLEKVKGKYSGAIPHHIPVGVGLSGRAAQLQKTLVANDLEHEQSHIEALNSHTHPAEQEYLHWIGSKVAVPLMVRGELKGVLAALKPQKNGFLNVDEGLVRDFAGRAAIAIDNALLDRQLKRRIDQLKALSEISTRIQAAQNPEAMLLLALTGITAKQGLQFSRAILFRVDDGNTLLRGELAIGSLTAEEAGRTWQEVEDKRFTLQDHLDRAERFGKDLNEPLNAMIRQITIPLRRESGAPALCLLERRTISIANARTSPLTNSQLVELIETSSFVAIPLMARGNTLGVLIVDNRFLPAEEIAEDDVQILETFAAEAALIIHNARLVKQNLERERQDAWRVFSASAAHGIASQVRDMRGALTRLFDSLDQQNRIPVAQTLLERLNRSVSQLQVQVRRFMELAQPRVLEFRPLNINDLVAEALEYSGIEHENIKVILHLAEVAPILHGDKQALLEAFQELIENATYEILQSPKRVKELEIRSRHQPPYVCIDFIDSGRGIAPEAKSKIFTPGYTTREEGTGVGLANIKWWIERHGGTIQEIGIYGKGAHFQLLIPVHPAEDQGGK